MARSIPDRTFSFNDDDELSLRGGGQDHFPNSQDTGFRDMQFPTAPAYTLPPRRNHDVSPPSPPAHQSYPSAVPQLPQQTDSSDSQPVPQPFYSRREPPPIQTRGYRDGGLDHSTSNRTASTATPGADNMGITAAGGGIAGVALGVANTNERDSGVEALQDLNRFSQGRSGIPPERGFDTVGSDTPYIPVPPPVQSRVTQRDPYSSPARSRSDPFDDENQHISAAPSPAQSTPRLYSSRDSIPLVQYPSQGEYEGGNSYHDNPYKRFSTAWDPRVARGEIDHNDIADDGDDGLREPVTRSRSILGLKTPSSSEHGAPVGAIAGGAAAGGVFGKLGSLVGKKNVVSNGTRDPSGQYGPVARQGFDDAGVEKSEWLSRQTSGRSRMRWIVGPIIVILVLAAIVGGIVGGVEASKKSKNAASSNSTQSQTAAQDDGHGDLTKDSAEIKALMGNPNLHKVFPGMDYTPWGVQHPECLKWPPSQNNVTRDMAVLSQLTNVVRLYGTDCNQTEMVLHAIDKLGLTNMKIWLGVWLATNTTTNDRGLNGMYDILAKNGAGPFAGVIVGNEVLYREDMTETQLGKILSDIRQNFTSQKFDLPVATSDLGDKWTPELAADTDIVMSNVHPFFAGVNVDVAAAWTWDFWQTKDVILTQGTNKKNIISEVGWPSAGGRDCGPSNCTDAIAVDKSSVAGIDEMNKFMSDFVCQSLANGTEYFW